MTIREKIQKALDENKHPASLMKAIREISSEYVLVEKRDMDKLANAMFNMYNSFSCEEEVDRFLEKYGIITVLRVEEKIKTQDKNSKR